MNISYWHFVLSLLLLAAPACGLWWLSRRLFRQTVVAMGQFVAVLVVLTCCYVYLFQWDSAWLNVVWIVLSGGVATLRYCRRRWLLVPVFVGMLVALFPVGLLTLLLVGPAGSVFEAWLFVPVMTLLQAECLFVSRRGLTSYVLNRREHGSLNEYLLGNGAKDVQALKPFIAAAVRRAYAPVLSQLLLVGVVFVPSLLLGLLIGGVEPVQAALFVLMLTMAGLCCSLLSLLASVFIYVKLKQDSTDFVK